MTRNQQKINKALNLSSCLQGAIRDIRDSICTDNDDARNECEDAIYAIYTINRKLYEVIRDTGVNPWC